MCKQAVKGKDTTYGKLCPMRSPDIYKIITVIVLILGAGLWQVTTLLAGRHPITNYPPKNTKVLALGGSLTVGTGASDKEYGFIPVLSKRLNTSIINKGVSGDTTVDALARLDTDVLSEDPGIVIIFLGANDQTKKIPNEETLANLETIITRCESHGATVLLLGYTARFDGLLNDLANKIGAIYVPSVLEGIIEDPALMSSDGIHPNDAGYLKIADKVAPMLDGLILAASQEKTK